MKTVRECFYLALISTVLLGYLLYDVGVLGTWATSGLLWYKQAPSAITQAERPVVNIPEVFREANYDGGSCVHASMIALLRWQGRFHTADYWRKHYSYGEHVNGLANKFDEEGIRYAYVTNGDVAFLEWACSTRRGCGITVMGGVHMVDLVHLDDKWAAILDNNDISKFKWIPRQKLIDEWQSSNGWAVTPIYTPAAPLPHITH